MPERIQLRRTKGWRKPEGAVVVSRPSKWGNPWMIKPVVDHRFQAADVVHRDRDSYAGRFDRRTREGMPRTGAPYWAVQMYKLYLDEHPELVADARRELGGHDLCCWCRLDQPCHGDVLLEVANS